MTAGDCRHLLPAPVVSYFAPTSCCTIQRRDDLVTTGCCILHHTRQTEASTVSVGQEQMPALVPDLLQEGRTEGGNGAWCESRGFIFYNILYRRCASQDFFFCVINKLD